MTNPSLATLIQNADAARAAFLALTNPPSVVPPARVFAAQELVRQTQEAVRAAVRAN